MNAYDYFFLLLRSGLNGADLSPAEADAVARLSPKQWDMLIHLAGRQTVTGLLYTAVERLPADAGLHPDIVLSLMSRAVSIEKESQRKAALTEQLVGRLKAEGLAPVVMKGIAVAAFYDHPLRRTSGDIDIYLPPGQTEAAFSLLPGQHAAPDGSQHAAIDGVDIDIHERYYDLHVAQQRLPRPGTPEATLLMLSTHILKHAIGPGVGLRQLCDLAMAWRALASKIDPGILLKAQRRAGIRRWDRLVASFLARELGQPRMLEALFPGAGPCSTEPLRRIVLEGGNFGHFAASRTKALAQSEKQRKRDTLARFLRRLPFSLHYAPREVLATMLGLMRGNLHIIE